MNALKVLLATIINGVAAAIFLTGPIVWKLVILMAITSSVGGFLGMAFARRVKPDNLRIGILAIGIALTCVYFYKAYLH